MARVVAVFGGGGAKSLAHAGAWKALLEAGLRPFHIVGTSMGAVMGAAFAAGSSYDRLVGIALSLHRSDFAALDAWALAKGVFARSTLKPEPLKRSIARLVPATRFAEMQIPFTVTTTDLDSGELVLFGALGQDGPLIDVLYASCALPLYFPPQTIGGRRLGEGGLRAVLGLDAARRVPADLVVAVDVGPGFDEPPAWRRRRSAPSRRGRKTRPGWWWCGPWPSGRRHSRWTAPSATSTRGTRKPARRSPRPPGSAAAFAALPPAGRAAGLPPPRLRGCGTTRPPR